MKQLFTLIATFFIIHSYVQAQHKAGTLDSSFGNKGLLLLSHPTPALIALMQLFNLMEK